MLIEEATWLKQIFDNLASEPGSTLLNVGSSTEYFRRVNQPYIDYYVLRPLRQRGILIQHLDMRPDEGVDVVCDLTDPDAEAAIEQIPQADMVLCSNLLEHVTDRELVARRLFTLTKGGGVLIATVPHCYRYHPDPIDTMYRPSNTELQQLFSSYAFEPMFSTILDADCGYTTIPEGFLPYLAYGARLVVKQRILKQSIPSERCKVSAVVLRKLG